MPELDSVSYYGIPNERYLLDDYTRFKTLEEVIQEYVSGVEVRKRKDNYQIRVFDSLRLANFQNKPMLLLDGVPVFDTNKLLSLDPLAIQRLDVITKRFFRVKQLMME